MRTNTPWDFSGSPLQEYHPGSRPASKIIPEEITANSYQMVSRTPENTDPAQYDFAFDGTVGAELLRDRIVLNLKDWVRGDDDLLANGVIVDPGAAAFNPVRSWTQSPVPTPGASTAARVLGHLR